MNQMKVDFSVKGFFLVICTLAGMTGLNAQAPDWLFVLEGSYVGRYEVPVSNGDVETFDARWDGKRSGQEDGFVLQVSWERETGIEKQAQVWNWNSATNQVDLMSIEGGQRTESHWFVENSGNTTLLTRGGSHNGTAVIQRMRLERLPGQLRVHQHYNAGDGNWVLMWRFILDDFVEED